MADNTKNAAPIKRKKAEHQRKRIALFVTGSMLALALSTAIIMTVAFSLITEGTYDFGDTPVASKTEQPQNDKEVVALLTKLVDTAKDDKRVFIKTSAGFDMDEGSIEYDGSDAEKKLVLFARSGIISHADENLYPEDYKGEFGNGFTAFPSMTLEAKDCVKASCAEGREDEYGEIVEDDCYFIKLDAKGETLPATKGTALYETFNMDFANEVFAGLMKELTETFTVHSFSFEPDSFKIEAKSDRFTDRLLSYKLIRSYNVTLKIEMTGDFEGVGTRTLSFKCSSYENYEYTWAGINFTNDETSVALGEEAQLAVVSKMNENSEYTVSFESSDPTVCTVDDMGYIKGIQESVEPVTITVKLSYLGVDYSDTCTVHVKTAVEKIKISDGSKALKVGEAAEISATLKPKDATYKNILWITEDESIATVTANDDGSATITALAQGTVKIIAVSEDGHFRDSCTVTVKNEEVK